MFMKFEYKNIFKIYSHIPLPFEEDLSEIIPADLLAPIDFFDYR